MKFVDVVDAEASNRASSLFELRSQNARRSHCTGSSPRILNRSSSPAPRNNSFETYREVAETRHSRTLRDYLRIAPAQSFAIYRNQFPFNTESSRGALALTEGCGPIRRRRTPGRWRPVPCRRRFRACKHCVFVDPDCDSPALFPVRQQAQARPHPASRDSRRPSERRHQVSCIAQQGNTWPVLPAVADRSA